MSNFYRRFGKRFVDLAITLPAAIVLTPVVGAIALLVRADSPGPTFFVQDRLGRHGIIFRAFKFRTMTDRPRTTDREILGHDSELTRVGYGLRRFKLDELPQIFNVINGDMSVVGPRPALPDQVTDYDVLTRQRLEVRPGLTGLAQVNGNIYLSWPERWKYDVRYVQSLSLGLDIKIILRTFAVIVLGEHKFLKCPKERVD